jgi:hypothetical protein
MSRFDQPPADFWDQASELDRRLFVGSPTEIRAGKVMDTALDGWYTDQPHEVVFWWGQYLRRGINVQFGVLSTRRLISAEGSTAHLEIQDLVYRMGSSVMHPKVIKLEHPATVDRVTGSEKGMKPSLLDYMVARWRKRSYPSADDYEYMLSQMDRGASALYRLQDPNNPWNE